MEAGALLGWALRKNQPGPDHVGKEGLSGGEHKARCPCPSQQADVSPSLSPEHCPMQSKNSGPFPLFQAIAPSLELNVSCRRKEGKK